MESLESTVLWESTTNEGWYVEGSAADTNFDDNEGWYEASPLEVVEGSVEDTNLDDNEGWYEASPLEVVKGSVEHTSSDDRPVVCAFPLPPDAEGLPELIWPESSLGLDKLKDSGQPRSIIDQAGTSSTIEPPLLKSDDPQLPLSLSSLHLDAGESIRCPLPILAWVDSYKMWNEMRLKDTPIVVPEIQLVRRHPSLQPIVRTKQLVWLMGVCERFHFHRETFFLAVDLYDRFMDREFDVKPKHVDMIAITCLYTASKLEENVLTDLEELVSISMATCTVDDVHRMEVFICDSLEWRLTDQVTVNAWMNIYLQLSSLKLRPPGFRKAFEYRAFSPETFAIVMKLLDICFLDINSRRFGSSVLAASAFYLASRRPEIELEYIGYALIDIQSCVDWLEPFSTVIKKHENPAMPCLKVIEGVDPKDVHNIQVMDVTTEMLEEVLMLRKLQERSVGGSSLSSRREL